MLSKMDPNRKISRHGVLRLTKVKRDNIESNKIKEGTYIKGTPKRISDLKMRLYRPEKE